MGVLMSKALAAGLISVAALALAPAVQADDGGDMMYRVGVDIQPGEYKYRVVGNGIGSWELCADANCNNSLDSDSMEGMGHTGYMTVTSNAKYLKTNDLILAPMS